MGRTVLIVFGIILLIAIMAGGGYLLLKDRSAPNTTSTAPPNQTNVTTTSSTETTSTTTVGDSILTVDSTVVATQSKKRFSEAKDRLTTWTLWKSNAQFSGLFMSFDQNMVLDSSNEIYVFDSPDDANHHYTISVSQSSGNSLRALVPKTDYQGALLPIKTEFWQSNYVDAIQFADKNGGSDFIKANDITSIDANLLRTSPNDFLYWVITYKTNDSANSLTIKMDAKEKKLVK